MSQANLQSAAASLIFILSETKSPIELNCLAMMLIPSGLLIPETQLSERRLLQVSIIPNVETQFEDEERISLFDFLPENTVVWLQDYDWCKERLNDCEEDLESFSATEKT